MKKTVMVIVTMVLAVLMAEPTAFAQDNPAAPADRPMRMMDGSGRGIATGYLRLKEELGLTDEQIAKLQDIRLQGQKEMIQVQADMRLKRLELAELMRVRGNDAAVKAKSAEIQTLLNEMAVMRTSHRLAHRAVFTDAQWLKVSRLRGTMQGRMGRGNRSFTRGGRYSGRGGRDFMRGGRDFMRGDRSSSRGMRTPRRNINW